MLTIAALNRVNFHYPVRNTPAVSLTQNLPYGQHAAVFSLGCGDLRHLLFTSHIDERPLDFTGCDLQPAVLARTALRLTLIADGKHETHFDNVWEIYYHFKITNSSLELLQNQAEKLHALGETFEEWQSDAYGSNVHFCDDGTLWEVCLIWDFYAKADAAGLKKYFDRVKAVRRDKDLTGWATLAAVRCAAPAISNAMFDMPKAHVHYWQHGTTSTHRDAISASTNFNPCFSTPGGNALLHYGSDPLLGFHLATAYAPVDTATAPNNNKVTIRQQSIQNLADAARNKFRDWARSFQKRSSTVTVRLYAGDAVSFGHLLQLKQAGKEGPACLYRDRNHFDPASLNKSLFAAGDTAAPTTFDVIDTSNLADHVGVLNFFVAARPLLRTEPWAAFYTETLLQYEGTFQAALEGLLCGKLRTVSLLIGLVLVDVATNTAPSAAAEISVKSLKSSLTGSRSPQQQQFTRLLWKQPMHLDELMASALMGNLLKHSLPNYQRASFVAFLRLVKTTVNTNWDAMVDHLLALIQDDSRLGTRANYWQELYLWMHMLGVHSVDALKRDPTTLGHRGRQQIHRWKNIPEVIAVTLKVPRKHLAFYTSFRDVSAVGTPPIGCSVSNHSSYLSGWLNQFAAVLTGFVFEAESDDLQHVYFSKAMPGLAARFPSTAPTKKSESSVSKGGIFSGGCSVRAKSLTAFTFEVTLGSSDVKYHLDFRVPVVASSVKTLIARKSSYTELVANATREYRAPSSFRFPVQRHQGALLLWNMSLVDLAKQPRLKATTEKHIKLGWLLLHMGIRMSARERYLRDNPSASMTAEERVMRDIKESLSYMMMHVAGVQKDPASLFAISCAEAEGINMLVIVSSLRLDLACRTVFLDAAVVQLTYELIDIMLRTLGSWTDKKQLCHLKVSTDELRLWKTLLPVWAERCRGNIWQHKTGPRREYEAAGRVPVTCEQSTDCLCSCGRGQFPVDYKISDSKAFKLLAEHATRVAISPIFFSPLVEDPQCPSVSATDRDFFGSAAGSRACVAAAFGDETPRCNRCGKAGVAAAADDAATNNAGGGGGGAEGRAALRVCSGCKKARYCSRGCQRADLKTHKLVCGK
ncbi:hypothetical protein Micbo1qcDRAFT_206636 [Microdochium bolleyi]|uniref:MYND-type domain-containing protein n=1 Tax=Microdochium bolleyi TaxID=196109 RepID=A0A136IVH9_9PEZI|nr:hypothetical protein Micbo1qcDRAFT_206636 [Microdochium bolleyi]